LTVRELWATTAASWIDSIRLLHTREIERIALAGTLILRAAFVTIAPAAGFLTLGGITPFAAGIPVWRDAAWGVAAALSVLAAATSPWIVSRIIDRHDRTLRRAMLVCEALASVFVLLGVPSWLTFAFVAGPLNWAMRPRWRLRPLGLAACGFAGLFAIGLLIAPGSRGTKDLILEVAIGLMCLGLISNSFGLLFPIVAAHAIFVLPAWHLKAQRFQQRQWRARAEPIAGALQNALEEAERAGTRSPLAAETASQLRRALAHISRLLAFPPSRPELLRRRTMEQVVEAVLTRATKDPARPLRAASPAFDPPDLAQLRLHSWRVANHLEVALARIASEALRHGEFEIRCSCRSAGDEVVMRVENDVPPGSPPAADTPAGRGAREIVAAVSQLPGGRLGHRGIAVGVAGVPVFAVEFAFAHIGLQR
ncbi:MAG: hypothetical protein ACRDZT_05820, partial [Acidimicrobiales bacterium]